MRVTANGHGFACRFFKLILLVLLIRITKKLPSDDESTNTALPESEFTSYRHFSEAVQTRVTFGLTTRWRHVGARISRYANSDSTFQLIRVVISGDVSENPGPTVNKPKCQQCFRTIARNHRIIICSSCDSTYHIKCGGVSPKQHALTELPFSYTTHESFSSLFGGNHEDSKGNLTADLATNADDLYNMANELNAAPKDIRVGHLNICSLRNKIDELRLIQNICRFDILGITETHLKGLCHPTHMREPMKTNLKKSARLFQVLSEILEGCFCLSKSQPSFDS